MSETLAGQLVHISSFSFNEAEPYGSIVRTVMFHRQSSYVVDFGGDVTPDPKKPDESFRFAVMETSVFTQGLRSGCRAGRKVVATVDAGQGLSQATKIQPIL